MKKILKSIIAFFFKKKEKPVDYERELWNHLEPGTYYGVYHDGKFQGYERNLFQVSKDYPQLKKSTLYNAFKGGKTPRTYMKGKFKVKECQKF